MESAVPVWVSGRSVGLLLDINAEDGTSTSECLHEAPSAADHRGSRKMDSGAVNKSAGKAALHSAPLVPGRQQRGRRNAVSVRLGTALSPEPGRCRGILATVPRT